MKEKTGIERFTTWIGSVPSLITHTVVFASSFILSVSGLVEWSFMLLILTTILSLEAIYLAIFIQMTVNRQAQELAEVSEDVEDIQEDIEEISEDIDEIQEDVDEIQEDVEEISEDEESEEAAEAERKKKQMTTLETLTADVQRLLKDLEELKRIGK
jgi:methyl-accepting chemotaxis protein